MGNYKQLQVWNKAMDLSVMVYQLTDKLPKQEMYSLGDQMRRDAISIPSNIAEGQSRISDKEFRRFLMIARGSGAELETQLILCVRLSYLQKEDVQAAYSLLQEIQRMLSILAEKVK